MGGLGDLKPAQRTGLHHRPAKSPPVKPLAGLTIPDIDEVKEDFPIMGQPLQPPSDGKEKSREEDDAKSHASESSNRLPDKRRLASAVPTSGSSHSTLMWMCPVSCCSCSTPTTGLPRNSDPS